MDHTTGYFSVHNNNLILLLIVTIVAISYNDPLSCCFVGTSLHCHPKHSRFMISPAAGKPPAGWELPSTLSFLRPSAGGVILMSVYDEGSQHWPLNWHPRGVLERPMPGHCPQRSGFNWSGDPWTPGLLKAHSQGYEPLDKGRREEEERVSMAGAGK